MTRRLLPLLAAVLLLGGAAAYLLIDDTGQTDQPMTLIDGRPPVEFDPPSLDFGEMPLNTTHAETVVMRNAGSAPLRVQTARPSCPCVQVDLAPVIIEPGTGVRVPLRMNSLSSAGLGTYTVSVMFVGYEDPAVLSVQRTAVE